MSEYFSNTDWKKQKLGKFSGSEIYKLFVGGTRPMTDEELKSRLKGDRRTTVDTLFGPGAETYIRQKVAEEITQEVKDEIISRPTEWGHENELDCSILFEKTTGLKGTTYGIGRPQFFEYGDYAGCSPDWELENECGAEFKCPYNSDIHLENLFIETLEEFKEKRWEYYCQCQFNMLVRKWKECFFVSFDPRMPSLLKMAIIRIQPDQEWINDFKIRLEVAIERKNDLMDKLLTRPSILLASNEDGVTIVSAA